VADPDVKTSLENEISALSAVEIHRAVSKAAETLGIPNINNPALTAVVAATQGFIQNPNDENALADLKEAILKVTGAEADQNPRARELYNLTIAGLDTGKFTIGMSNNTNLVRTKEAKRKQSTSDRLLREVSNDSIAAAAEAAANYAASKLGMSQEKYGRASQIARDGFSQEGRAAASRAAEGIAKADKMPPGDEKEEALEDIEADVSSIAQEVEEALLAHQDYRDDMKPEDRQELIRIITAQIIAEQEDALEFDDVLDILNKMPDSFSSLGIEEIKNTVNIHANWTGYESRINDFSERVLGATSTRTQRAEQLLSDRKLYANAELPERKLIRARYVTPTSGEMTRAGSENPTAPSTEAEREQIISEQQELITSLVYTRANMHDNIQNLQELGSDPTLITYLQKELDDLDQKIGNMNNQLAEYTDAVDAYNAAKDELNQTLEAQYEADSDGLNIGAAPVDPATGLALDPFTASMMPTPGDKIEAQLEELEEAAEEVAELEEAIEETSDGELDEQDLDTLELTPDEAQLSFDANKSEIYALYSANPQHDEESISLALKMMGISESQIKQVMEIAKNDPNLQNLAPQTQNTPTQTTADLAMKAPEVKQASAETPANNATLPMGHSAA